LKRLGSTHTLKINFRLLAATNRDFSQGAQEGQFRSDLYYRLNVFPVRVPPLRDRREDIPLLAEHFVRKCAARMNKSITSIPAKTMQSLQQWDWPGNIRELENFLERSVILTHGSVLQSPLRELEAVSERGTDETLETIEREHIVGALRLSRGRLSGINGAAERLGMNRTTLQSKLRRLGIDPEKYRT
jgi:formate hydrogenlyase transcriptional activator